MSDTTKPRAVDLTGHTLNRAFAEAIGWKVTSFVREEEGEGPVTIYCLVTPSGNDSGRPWQKESSAWNAVPEFSTRPDLLGSILEQIDINDLDSWVEKLRDGHATCFIATKECEKYKARGTTRGDAAIRAFLLATGAAI